MVTKNCKICKKEFESKLSENRTYCSWECYIKDPNKKLSSSIYKEGQNIADKHPRWKGGMWCYAKKEVYKRDNGKCKICGLYEPDIMDIAHIIPVMGNYNRKYTPQDIENLITLCPNCHRRFDMGKVTI